MASDTIVVLTGAGVSAESGLPTFRGADGLWEGHRPEEVATPGAFYRDQDLVHRFYNARRRALLDPAVAPNPAHTALAELGRRHPGRVVLVTQNVDDLHARAGGAEVWPMHGELLKIRCTACGAARVWHDDLDARTPCPACKRAGGLRPDIVWFGEVPRFLDEIEAALAAADLFVAIGTSGLVYPAAGFAAAVRAHGCGRLIEVNAADTATSSAFDEHRIGPASATVPALVAELLGAD